MREYSAQDLAEEINSHLSGYNYCWLRVTGGEPFFDLERGIELSEVLKPLTELAGSFERNVVIQTNGLLLANVSACSDILVKLSELSLNVLIEVSLKGTSREEFGLLTGFPHKMYKRQLEAVENLRKMISGKPNLAYRLVMGFGPNKVSRDLPAYMFVHPKQHNLLQMREKWDSDFTKLYETYLNESPSGRLGFSMACLVTKRWGVHPLQNIKKQGMLVGRHELSDQDSAIFLKQWKSIHPYFTEMNPGDFYALEFP